MDRQPPAEVRRFVAAVRARIPLERAILFGSRAREDALETSDYDLILVSPAFEGRPFYERPPPLLLLWERAEDLDLLCYTPEEFEQKRQGLNVVGSAAKEGIEVAA